MDKAQITDYYQMLIPSGKAMEMRAIGKDALPLNVLCHSPEELSEHAGYYNNKGLHVYTGVIAREELRRPVPRGRVLWADYDEKQGGLDMDRLRSLPMHTARVMTGGGFHLYWVLEDDYDPEIIQAANKLIQEFLRTDTVGDYPRVLRAPSTINWKYPYTTSLHLTSKTVSLSEFCFDEVEISRRAQRSAYGGYGELGYEPVVEAIRELPSWAIQYVNEGLPPGCDRSKELYKLAIALLRGGMTPHAVHELFCCEEGPLGDKARDKGLRADRYFRQMVNKAVEVVCAQ